jgi:hypothetical protein
VRVCACNGYATLISGLTGGGTVVWLQCWCLILSYSSHSPATEGRPKAVGLGTCSLHVPLIGMVRMAQTTVEVWHPLQIKREWIGARTRHSGSMSL